jgi:hypothetical protein
VEIVIIVAIAVIATIETIVVIATTETIVVIATIGFEGNNNKYKEY